MNFPKPAEYVYGKKHYDTEQEYYNGDQIEKWRENTANWLKSLLTKRDATSPSAVEIIREVLERLK